MLPIKPELNSDERVLLKAWLWEHVHDKPDGPAHELARRHGVNLLPCLVAAVPLLGIGCVSRLIEFLDTEQPQVPTGWPWPQGSNTTRLLQHIRAVVEQNRIHKEWDISPESLAAVLLGLTLTVVLAWAGLATIMSCLAAFFITLGLFMARKHMRQRGANRRMQFECQAGFVAGEQSNPGREPPLCPEHRRLTWDTRPPGDVDGLHCQLCGDPMRVWRNRKGGPPLLVFKAALGMAEDHDLFVCPHTQEPWHRQASDLKLLALEKPSEQMRQGLEKEMQHILQTRQPTKAS